MAINVQPGQTVRVKINKHVASEPAKRTLERLFLKDRAVSDPLDRRSRNFIPLPRRRGGRVWTKRPNKIHPSLNQGAEATITATPQAIRDLNSVERYVEVQPQ